MPIIKKEYTLYGLDGYTAVIENIIELLDVHSKSYEVRVILTEALSNAFIHGNKEDATKPIHIRVISNKTNVRLEIEDCGSGFEYIEPNVKAVDGSIINENYRGINLINCFADTLEVKGNTMIVTKYISENG